MYKTHTRFGALLEGEMSKKCMLLWREAHLQVKKIKTHQVRSTSGSWDVEKVHAIVARSTFPSENVQNTPGSEHFWTLRRRKSACHCGMKHISKWTCTKHTRFGALLDVETSKKCMPLWREAHFQVKMYKTHQVRSTFGRSDVVLRGRHKGFCILPHVSKTRGLVKTPSPFKLCFHTLSLFFSYRSFKRWLHTFTKEFTWARKGKRKRKSKGRERKA